MYLFPLDLSAWYLVTISIQEVSALYTSIFWLLEIYEKELKYEEWQQNCYRQP